MDTESLARSGHDVTTREQELLDRLEEEIARLREKRPAPSERIDRATSIIVTHLACRQQKVIRVRLRGGRARFLVDGSGGAVYVVDPATWTCSCPDFHRRDATCKHVLCCYVLWLASLRTRRRACVGCGKTLPRRHLREVHHDDPAEHWFLGDLVCRECCRTGGIEW